MRSLALHYIFAATAFSTLTPTAVYCHEKKDETINTFQRGFSL